MANETKKAVQRLHDLRLLSRYEFGRTLRRWYLRKLLEHYLFSAANELIQAKEHQRAADEFGNLAGAMQRELDEAMLEAA